LDKNSKKDSEQEVTENRSCFRHCLVPRKIFPRQRNTQIPDPTS
jgi:hypothetical protein